MTAQISREPIFGSDCTSNNVAKRGRALKRWWPLSACTAATAWSNTLYETCCNKFENDVA